jgi:glycogen synthase
MRALILSWEYPPLIEGGLARHVRKLAESLARQGIEVHVLTRSTEQSPLEELVAGVYVHRVTEPSRPGALDELVAWVEKMNADMERVGTELAKRWSFEVVHAHDWLVAVAADRLASTLDAALVATIHATEHGRHQGNVDNYPQSHIHAIESWFVGRAERVVVCSSYMHSHVTEIFNLQPQSVEVIGNGVDPSELVPAKDLEAVRRKFASPNQRLVLLVGRLVYEKGFQIALEALPGLIERVSDVRFVVAGSGTHEAQLRAQASELGLDPHGTFLGWIDDVLLHSLYRVADLCVVPSLYEPFGLVALEAMASGCPCLVADTGGLREVVPDDAAAGLRFRCSDPASLGQAAERLLIDDDLRERVIAQALEHVLSFDWSEIAGEISHLYERITATRSGV